MYQKFNKVRFGLSQSGRHLKPVSWEGYVFSVVLIILVLGIAYQHYLILSYDAPIYLQDVMGFLTNSFMLFALAGIVLGQFTDKKTLEKMKKKWFK